MKATAGMIKLCHNLLEEEKQNYVGNTKDLLSLTMKLIMLLGHVNFSMNNTSMGRIKISLQKDLLSLCEADKPPTTSLLGDDFQKKIREGKESSKLKSYPRSYLPQYTGYQTRKGATKQTKIPEQQTISKKYKA